ncbi:prolyl oligopeptidase family serine peptidase [Streptomyces sp. NBC_01294]|uniref:prolyl oligopeptidase family serine peptidase n=1 Tax=Streptomyces sp. NBC_01294 TaxID=2903815 RepID=UPI002DD7A7D9|nr:prolyl oligopeptidase family serine peptidase [Streptomyces sp. NBC_01294]WRZ55399.1 prolyl oligopeptidase family serine peptidase [Streptomyces sp. NBC_01294]WRZ61297.1 prolyl oligopeptidase family serine peptidase [Streptomyces sp. NBC_01294]
MSDEDPYLWLEDVSGESALAWVRERNAETVDALTGAPGFKVLEQETREVLDDDGRIPHVVRRGPHLYNFWQDADHVRGLWRRTTLEEYRTDRPAWEVLLDLDALAEAEDEKWAWAGSRVLAPEHRHALVLLSRDGADACVVREFDLETLEFVADGFAVAEAKTRIGWIDRDRVWIGTDFGPGSMSPSGYPLQVRRWRRGTPIEDAEPVYEGRPSDLSASGWRDDTPGFERDFVHRQIDFWNQELFLLREESAEPPLKIDVPDDAGASVHRRWLTVTTKSPWLGHPAGSLLAFDFDAFLAGEREAEVLFTPDEHIALAGYSWTRNHLILSTRADVSSRMELLTPGPGGWSRAPLPGVPPLSTASVTCTDPDVGDEYFHHVSGFLQPSTLYRGTAGGDSGGDSESVKQSPALFDTAGLTVRQYFATSADGTRVPYFVVGPEDRPGPGPTLLYGYGGFEISMVPQYSAVTGRAWLARGGTYVVAGIRGGHEYGPGWHKAALGANRVRAYEDFAAVARDLTARDITTPAQLGIEGGSNGGLLMGAMLTRDPELFGAVVAHVPLLDMLRFHKLLAGASWIAEYGDPDDPADRPHLERISPYHQVRADGPAYPPLLLLTSTRDDRVHPGHARKMAARLREFGHPVLFHEHLGGGHAGATDHRQTAFNEALVHTFLWERLTPSK